MCFFNRFKINRMLKHLRSMQQARLNNQASAELLKKELVTYARLADIYERLKGKKRFPFAREQAIAAYRAAALLNDATAQYTLGIKLLDEAKLRENLQQGEILASDSNAFFMKELYKEAHGFLLAAENQQHIKAKRIRGLCYINGWGVPVDKDLGFDLVVDSIDQENSWDRVQKIFAELGINKSSFLSELFKHRKK